MLYISCPNPSCPRKSLRVRPEDVQTARTRALRVRCRRCRERFILRPEEVRGAPPGDPKRSLWSRVAGLLTETFRGSEDAGGSDVAPADDPTSAVPSTGEAAGQATTDPVPDAQAPTLAALPGWINSLPDTPRLSGECGRRLEADPIPTRIGRFEVHACLGRGGFGKVYRCHDPQLARSVAVKVPHRDKLETSQQRQRFFKEARSAAQLRHPHIVPIYEVGQDNDRPYIVFAFIEGSTLADASDQGRLSRRAAVAIVRDLAEALAYAHRLGIVHRDVKPANVLLDAEDVCHLADFGLARRHDPAEAGGKGQADPERVASGTAAYMAPEQWRGQAQAASDQYSLGILLYELLCGEPPFVCDRRAAFRLCHESQPPRPPRSSNPSLPRDLEAICLKTLAKKPEERYGDCQELADDLRRWLEGEPVKARPLGAGERLLRWCRREPKLAAALSFALAFLLAFALVMFRSASREREHGLELQQANEEIGENAAEAVRQRLEAEQQQQKAEEEKRVAQRNEASSRIDQALQLCEKGEVGQGLVRLVDARRLALNAWAGDLVRVIDFNLGAWRRQLHALEVMLPHDGEVTTAVYARGGRIVATASGRMVQLWDASDGKPLVLLPALQPQEAVIALAVGGSKESLLLVSGSSHLDLWDLSGAPARQAIPEKIRAKGEEILAASLSPDGQTVLVGGSDGHGGGWARLWRRGQMQTLPLSGLIDPVNVMAFSRDGSQCLTGSGRSLRGAVQVWDVHSGRALGPTLKHARAVSAAAFSPDGTEVLTATRDLFEGEAQLWDVASGQRKGAPLLSGLEILSVAFSPDGRQAAIGGQDRAVCLWDLRSRQQIGSPLRHARDVNSVAFSPAGRALLTASDDGTACLWQLSTGLLPSFSCSHFPGRVLAAACDRQRNLFCTGTAMPALSIHGRGLAGQTRIWDGKTGAVLAVLPHPMPVSALAWHPQGHLLMTGCWDGKVRLWAWPPQRDAQPREITPSLPPGQNADRVQALAFSSDGNQIAVGWRDGLVEIHDSRQDKMVRQVEAHSARLYAVAFHPDGKRFLTASQDRTIRQWDVRTGERISAPMKHPDAVLSAVYSSDGEHILSGYAGGARLWRADSGTPIGAPFQHQAGVFGAALRPGDASILLTGGTDRIARLWDVATGKPLGPAFAHGGAVLAAAFLQEDTMLTAGLNGYARVWHLPGRVEVSPEQITRWVEVITGIELKDDGTIGILEPTAWEQRRQELKEAGGPPALEESVRRQEAPPPEAVVPQAVPNPRPREQEPVQPAPEEKPRPAGPLSGVGMVETDVSLLLAWLKAPPLLPLVQTLAEAMVPLFSAPAQDPKTPMR